MVLNKKMFLAAAVVASSAIFAPLANAQVADSTTEGATVEYLEGPSNAAAAVWVEYSEEGEVQTLSAASAFGEMGAAASVTPQTASSLGTSSDYGYIETYDYSEDGPITEETYIYFDSEEFFEGPF